MLVTFSYLKNLIFYTLYCKDYFMNVTEMSNNLYYIVLKPYFSTFLSMTTAG